MNNYNYCPQYLATLDELQASRHSESRRPMHFGAKLEARFDIFHFIQSDIIFGIVNPSQWKANISSPASKLNAFPVNLHWLQDSKVFPVCWILIGELLYFRFHSSLSRYRKNKMADFREYAYASSSAFSFDITTYTREAKTFGLPWLVLMFECGGSLHFCHAYACACVVSENQAEAFFCCFSNNPVQM